MPKTVKFEEKRIHTRVGLFADEIGWSASVAGNTPRPSPWQQIVFQSFDNTVRDVSANLLLRWQDCCSKCVELLFGLLSEGTGLAIGRAVIFKRKEVASLPPV